MIVYSGIRRTIKIMTASAPCTSDPAELCREAVEHCNKFGFGIDLTFRDDIIEVRPGDDPARLAAAFDQRAGERARPISSPATDHGGDRYGSRATMARSRPRT